MTEEERALLEEEELNRIKDNSPYALPDNPAESGWTAAQIKEKFWKGLIVLYDILKGDRNSLETKLEEIDEAIEDLQNVQENASAIKDEDGNNIKETYAKIADIADGTIACLKYIKENGETGNIEDIANRVLELNSALGSFISVNFTNGKAKKAINADYAEKAIKDGEGNVIASHYASLSLLYSFGEVLNGILNGSTTIEKARKDQDGNLISLIYASKNYVNDKVARSNLVTVLGEASQQLNGLMSATDKSRLDALYALLGVTDDVDTVVNTINEVLSIFNQYPEGVSVANSLASKVDLISDQNISGAKTFYTYDPVNQIKKTIIINGATINYIVENQVQSANDSGVITSSVLIDDNGITISNFKGNNKESISISNSDADGKIELNYSDLEQGMTSTIFLPKNPGTLALQHEVPNNQSTSVIVGNAVTNINGRVFQNYTATLITAGGYTFYQILKNGVNPTAEEAKEYMKYMTGSEFLPIYNYDYPRQTIFVFADRSIWKPQYSSNDGLRLYRISEPLALETNTFNVINASEMTDSSHFTQAQFNLINSEKITVIKGGLSAVIKEDYRSKIIFFPPVQNGNLYEGMYYGIGQYGKRLGTYRINTTSNYLLTVVNGTIDFQSGYLRINDKTIDYYLNNVYPYATNSTTQIEYETINNISVSANTTFTLATAPENTYPEYKANITNSGANAITLTFTGIAHILCNDDNCVVSNGTNSTITLPAGISIEISILNGEMLAVNFSAN